MSLIIRHLNGDTTWLIRWNGLGILIDPWLVGVQSDYSRYFSCQEHRIKSSIENVDEIKDEIDLILISHHYSDHCHEQTLRSLSRSIPIFATKNAFQRIRRWNYFEHLFLIPELINSVDHFTLDELSEKKLSLSKFDEISVGYLSEKGLFSAPSLHGVTVISFLMLNKKWKSVFYIPHGCEINSILKWLNKQSDVDVEIVFHGLVRVWNPQWLGGLLNYGYDEGEKLVQRVNAKYWISTHDEDKVARGFISFFLKRDSSNLQNQLSKNLSSNNQQMNSKTKICQIANGDSLTIDWNI